jgi:hypothetical protein
MLVEIFSEEETFYMKAPVKPFDVLDLVGLKLEEELKPSTPEELYASLPTKKLKENEVIRKAKEEDDWRKRDDLEGVYKVDNLIYESLPTWKWFTV